MSIPASSVMVCWQPGTEPASALEWAGRTARATDQQLVVYSSIAELLTTIPSEEQPAARRQHEEALRSFAAGTDQHETRCQLIVSHDDPRVDLLDTARSQNAAMIVVGTNPASSGPGLLRLGSLIEFLAHHTAVPLVVIRDAVSEPERLAVFVDGTDDGTAAVRWAAVHARRAGSQTMPVILEPGMRAAPQLIEAADDLDADLIVVGAPRLVEVLGRRVGGVALKVLHDSARSMVLVPHEQET